MADYDGFAWSTGARHWMPRMMSGNPRLQEVLPQGGRLVSNTFPMVGDLWRLQEELT